MGDDGSRPSTALALELQQEVAWLRRLLREAETGCGAGRVPSPDPVAEAVRAWRELDEDERAGIYHVLMSVELRDQARAVDFPSPTLDRGCHVAYGIVMNTEGHAMTTTETIAYSYTDESHTHCTGAWTGDRGDALAKAVETLGADPAGEGSWSYHDDATRSRWVVGEDDMVRLGAAILDGVAPSAAYSLWCAESDAHEAE